MNTSELRYLLRFVPSLKDLSVLLLDDVESSTLSCEEMSRINQAWDDLSSINCILTNLLKHRPLPF